MRVILCAPGRFVATLEDTDMREALQRFPGQRRSSAHDGTKRHAATGAVGTGGGAGGSRDVASGTANKVFKQNVLGSGRTPGSDRSGSARKRRINTKNATERRLERWEAAEADIGAAQAQVEAAGAKVQAAHSEIAARDAEVRLQQFNLSQTKIFTYVKRRRDRST